MSAALYSSLDLTIGDLERIKLPLFQRKLVWTQKKKEDFIDTLRQGMSIHVRTRRYLLINKKPEGAGGREARAWRPWEVGRGNHVRAVTSDFFVLHRRVPVLGRSLGAF